MHRPWNFFSFMIWMIIGGFILELQHVSSCPVSLDEALVVKTKSGLIKGITLKSFTREINAFLGVPFATPPIGDLRFHRTVPVKPWGGIYAATKISPPCLQFIEEQDKEQGPWRTPVDKSSEDCLYLNIWTPTSQTKSTNSSLKPVVVFIYGGSFQFGSSDIPYYDGRILADLGDVVVVNFNYRLGAFGFLNAGVPDAPGNQGMYDQAMALSWIKENIENFGGDPDVITLMGHSAGSMSVGLHLLSPITKNLFRRAILISASPNAPHFLEDPSTSLDLANDLADRLGCLVENRTITSHPKDVVNCLRGQYGSELLRVQEVIISQSLRSLFLPRFGDEFLPQNPHVLLREGSKDSVKDIIVGTTADEGSLFLRSSFPEDFPIRNQTVNLTLESTRSYMDKFLSTLGISNTRFIRDSLLSGSADLNDTASLRKILHDAIGDFLFLCPTVYFSEQKSDQGNNVYYFQTTYRPSYTRFAEWMGVAHSIELPFLFGYALRNDTNYTEDDVEFSKRWMDTIATFARTGIPPPQLNVSWPKYDTDDVRYMEMHAQRANILRDGPHKENCDFLRIIFDFAV